MAGLFLMLPTLAQYITKMPYLCLAFACWGLASFCVSVLHFAVLSIDRYLFIVHPYVYQCKTNGRKYTLSVLLAIWIFGFAYSFIPLVIELRPRWEPVCFILPLVVPFWYISTVYIAFFGITALVTIICYWKIFMLIIKQKEETERTEIQIIPTVQQKVEHDTDGTSSSEGTNMSKKNREKRNSRSPIMKKLRPVLPFFIIHMYFFLSWAPSLVIETMDAFTQTEKDLKGMRYVLNAVAGMTVVGTCLMYMITEQEISRVTIGKLVQMICRRKQQHSMQNISPE